MLKYNDPKISRVIELELKITRSIINGHKPSADDEFKLDREELEQLRKELNIKKRSSHEQY
jgi:hypothetical protein